MIMFGHKKKKIERHIANATILALVFISIFAMISAALLNVSIYYGRLLKSKDIKSEAFNIAESGLEYYEWFLSVFPNDPTDGTSGPGPYIHDVLDKETGEKLGAFELKINPKYNCKELQYMDIESTGYSEENPNIKKTVKARILKPSVANFSYVIDADVWAGASRNIVGPYHSNGGIRMDGTNNSIVTSAKSTWLCTSSFGCSPSVWVPGVFGSGPNSNLWVYPTKSISSNTFSLDFVHLKDLAQNYGGIYLPEFTGEYGDDRQGYWLRFRDNGTVDIYKVYYASGVWGYREEYGYNYSWNYGWRYERNRIRSYSYLGNFAIPSECSLIYSEEKLWVEGELDGKLTVVAARTTGSYQPEIVLSNNITYKDEDGSDGLLLFAQSYILIPEYSPNYMYLNGIFVAQNGSFGRSLYYYNTRDTLTIHGTVVSKERVGTSWGCGFTGYFCSGYANRINSYDRFLRDDPPPFIPSISDDLLLIRWSEE